MTAAPVEKQLNGRTAGFDPVALARAEAIRTEATAKADAARIEAEAKAEAERAKAIEEARKQKLANDKAEQRAAEEKAARAARIAEHNRKKAAAERAEREEAAQAERARQQEEQKVQDVAAADDRWRAYALNFYRVCAVVALPVQVSAFYNPRAIWLMAAPLMLEGGAWVVLKGAAAAVANRQPSWHYRLIAWLLAFIAAGINLWHGLQAFDPATALGTAFASIAGPGVWDLHEHGRIRKRDGVPTRRERKAAEKAAKAEAARLAAEEAKRAAEKEAAAKAAEEERQRLREERQREFEDVWAEAVKIGAAVGKAPDDPAVWPRAYRNIEGCDPGESIESITARRAAEKRVQAALAGTPVNTVSKTTNAQRASQVPGAKKPRVYTPPKNRGKRTKGDVKYTPGVRNQASLAAKNAAKKEG